MGRKSTNKTRQNYTEKTEIWVKALLPKLSTISITEITMDELAALIGKSKSTIYQYFPSKEALIEYMVSVRLAQMKPILEMMAQPTDNPKQAFQQFLVTICEHLQDLSPSLLGELKDHFPIAWELVQDYLNELLEVMRNFYRAGSQHGYFQNISTELILAIDQYFVFQFLPGLNHQTSTKALQDHVKDYLQLRFEGIAKV